MQRMLVGLVLFLTASIAVLGAVVYRLSDDVATVSARRPGRDAHVRAATKPEPGAEASRVETLEDRMARVVSELASLRDESRRLAREQERAAARKHRRPSASSDSTNPDAAGNTILAAADRMRDGEGGFVITEEDEDFFLALQKRVDRRRRIEGMTKNLMRRVKTLVDNSEIDALTVETQPGVEAALGRYVVASDDMVTRYVRKPDEELKKLTAAERRERMAVERERFVEDARVDLERILGNAQAQKVLDRTVARTYGFRRSISRGR